MESCSHADTPSAQQSTEPSSAFTEGLQRTAVGHAFGLPPHPSVSHSSYPTAWLQGMEKLQRSKSSCIDSSGCNMYPRKEAVTHFTGLYIWNIHRSSTSPLPSVSSPNLMMDETPFSMVDFKPSLTSQKMEVVVVDEARTQHPKPHCACYHYQSRSEFELALPTVSEGSLIHLTIFCRESHMWYPCTCILKLVFSQQKSCMVSWQFNDETGNACTCCLRPVCHVTLSSQLL